MRCGLFSAYPDYAILAILACHKAFKAFLDIVEDGPEDSSAIKKLFIANDLIEQAKRAKLEPAVKFQEEFEQAEGYRHERQRQEYDNKNDTLKTRVNDILKTLPKIKSLSKEARLVDQEYTKKWEKSPYQLSKSEDITNRTRQIVRFIEEKIRNT